MDKNVFLNNITWNQKKTNFCETIIVHTFERYSDPNMLTVSQRSADWARLSKRIEPVLTKEHRTKIKKRNFLLQEPAPTSFSTHLP